MAKKTVTVCHCLKLIPIDKIIRFARIAGNVIMASFDYAAVDPATVPGSVLLSTEVTEGKYRRKITFEITDVGERTESELSRLKRQRLVATYRDESGNLRVCGSPNYPLSLDYYDEGGVMVVTLAGESDAPDGFMTEG